MLLEMIDMSKFLHVTFCSCLHLLLFPTFQVVLHEAPQRSKDHWSHHCHGHPNHQWCRYLGTIAWRGGEFLGNKASSTSCGWEIPYLFWVCSKNVKEVNYLFVLWQAASAHSFLPACVRAVSAYGGTCQALHMRQPEFSFRRSTWQAFYIVGWLGFWNIIIWAGFAASNASSTASVGLPEGHEF